MLLLITGLPLIAAVSGWSAGETLAYGEMIMAFFAMITHMHLVTVAFLGLVVVLYAWTSTVSAVLYTVAWIVVTLVNRGSPPLI